MPRSTERLHDSLEAWSAHGYLRLVTIGDLIQKNDLVMSE